MLLGTLIGGFVEVFIPRQAIRRFLPERRYRAVFIGAALGVMFPVCECAIFPVVRSLLKKRIPLSAAVAFLLGDSGKFEGNRVTSEGMVYRNTKTGENVFMILRFAVVCCAADALFVQLVVTGSSTLPYLLVLPLIFSDSSCTPHPP